MTLQVNRPENQHPVLLLPQHHLDLLTPISDSPLTFVATTMSDAPSDREATARAKGKKGAAAQDEDAGHESDSVFSDHSVAPRSARRYRKRSKVSSESEPDDEPSSTPVIPTRPAKPQKTRGKGKSKVTEPLSDEGEVSHSQRVSGKVKGRAPRVTWSKYPALKRHMRTCLRVYQSKPEEGDARPAYSNEVAEYVVANFTVPTHKGEDLRNVSSLSCAIELF